MPDPTEARALWITGPRRCELRAAWPGEGLRVRTLFSGISRGTEALVFGGRVPDSEHERMRGPRQEGALPFPVKYGYACVGRTDAGDTVFCLHPHQDVFAAPPEALIPVPPAVPPGRAVLAANMETALNILWDAGAGPGDRINVFGAGVVGLLVAHLASRLPGVELRVTDIADRSAVTAALGLELGAPLPDADIAINASASGAALEAAMNSLGPEGRVVEASWHGDRPVALPLGGAFHARRLSITASQVGQVAASRRPRWPHARRLAKALELLADPRLDALISGETDFDELPAVYGTVLDDPATLCHRVRY